MQDLKATTKTFVPPGGHMSYSIHVGPRGGEYINYNGKMTSLAKFKKKVNKQPSFSESAKQDPVIHELGWHVCHLMDMMYNDPDNRRDCNAFIEKMRQRKKHTFYCKAFMRITMKYLVTERVKQMEDLLSEQLELIASKLSMKKAKAPSKILLAASYGTSGKPEAVVGYYEPTKANACQGRDVTLHILLHNEREYLVQINDNGIRAFRFPKFKDTEEYLAYLKRIPKT